MGKGQGRAGRVQVALTVLALCGCKTSGGGDRGAGLDPCARSDGQRLEAGLLTASDGSREVGGWRDTQTGGGCRFVQATDGTIRCLPTPGFGLLNTAYLDAACTRRASVDDRPPCLQDLIGAPKYALEDVAPDRCSFATHVYALAGSSIPAVTYSKASDGSCVSTPNTDSRVVYEAGSEVSPATFVAASRELAGARIKAPVWVGSDGSRGRTFELFHDSEKDVDCDFMTAADGANRCLPVPTLFSATSFRDAACRDRIAVAPPVSCPGGVAMFAGMGTPSGDACRGDPMHVYPLGAKLALSTVYGDNGNVVCDVFATGPDLEYRAIGPEVPAADFVAGTTRADSCDGFRTGGARLEARYLVSDDGAKAPLGWFDTETAGPCDFGIAADGSLRCLPPPGLAITELFLDAACSRRLAAAPLCTPPDRLSYVSEAIFDAACALGSDFRSRIYQAGVASVPPVTYARPDGSSCTAQPNTAGATFYEVGAEVPPTFFVSGSYAP